MKKIKFIFLGLLFLSEIMNFHVFAGLVEQGELISAILSDNESEVQAILKDPIKCNKINLIERREDGWNPLSIAIVRGNPAIVTALLDQKPSLSSGILYNSKEYSLFILAAQTYRKGEYRVFRILLERMTPDDFDREFKSAIRFHNPILAMQLKSFAPKPIHEDCPICLCPSGSTGANPPRIDGSESFGPITFCTECAHSYCTSCWNSVKPLCSLCRCNINSIESDILNKHLDRLPEFTGWVGQNVPLPIEMLASAKSVANQDKGSSSSGATSMPPPPPGRSTVTHIEVETARLDGRPRGDGSVLPFHRGGNVARVEAIMARLDGRQGGNGWIALPEGGLIAVSAPTQELWVFVMGTNPSK